jgi:hypothetical protein
MSPQAQFLLFCRLGLGTTQEVFSMCDYSLKPLTHHDALEFSDGQIVLLTDLFEIRKQQCSSFQHNLLPRPRRRPRNASRTSG